MKKVCILICLGVLVVSQVAFATGFSSTTNGVYLAVESWGGAHSIHSPHGSITNEPFLAGNELSFLAFCTTGRVELQYSPEYVYFAKIRMTDKDGKEITKTTLGKKFGSKFDGELHPWNGRSVGILLAEGSYEKNDGRGMAKPFPSPQDLFEIKKPGFYTMEIQMQMFRVIKAPQWKREPILFSPIKIRVEKVQD